MLFDKNIEEKTSKQNARSPPDTIYQWYIDRYAAFPVCTRVWSGEISFARQRMRVGEKTSSIVVIFIIFQNVIQGQDQQTNTGIK